MSNQTNSFSSPLKHEFVKNIDQLNLPTIQKHHVRLLAHCLAIFKDIVKDDISMVEEDGLLKKWCERQSQKFNDKNFNQLFYEQMSAAAKKLDSYSKRTEKSFKELDLEDLINIVNEA